MDIDNMLIKENLTYDISILKNESKIDTIKIKCDIETLLQIADELDIALED